MHLTVKACGLVTPQVMAGVSGKRDEITRKNDQMLKVMSISVFKRKGDSKCVNFVQNMGRERSGIF